MKLKVASKIDTRLPLKYSIPLNSRSFTYSTFEAENNESIILHFKLLVNIPGSSRQMQPPSTL